SSLEDRQEAARIEKPAAVVDLNKNKIISSREEEKTEEPAKEYTIQVASFKTKTYAQKEAVRLEQKGIKALLMPRGNFVIVCVGNFSQKQEANTSLTELKKIYQDCFIRRL
ncbi:MAG: SPOR domain-containing protein, partial [Candidatus Omnitrophica bacterium]|nr:SPOR domain-containing protein [Candidatus Omnitrophota bacterium]